MSLLDRATVTQQVAARPNHENPSPQTRASKENDMGGGNSSAPKPDPNIGLAAMKSAETGEKMFGWYQDQAEITNEWAAEDRGRWETVFRPLQDSYISAAQTWDSADRKNQRAASAMADTKLQARLADSGRVRQAMAMGVNPASGAFQSASRKAALDTGLAAAGAANLARRQVEAEAESKRANAINMGSGLSVNPATSMGISNNAMSVGGSAAMEGYNQQGSLLETQYDQQMQQWKANQKSQEGLFGAVGSLAGLFMPPLGMLSSKEAKTDKKPLPKGMALGAIRDMPVEAWRYKPGMGDGGAHVGPYAEDFHKATGAGDGKSIPIVSAIGVTMGAIRDLDAKVSKLERKKAA